ncbi:MAG TPA: glycosyltransferase [Chitinophagaceae bacterium]|nr:glycosyltransferase [Chitinophagaceae bacterium]
MDLSVIIVNYNVRYFLEQCLHSVRKAAAGLRSEIFVVDNDSEDESLAYLRPLFPEVTFIASTANEGFAKACNKGLALASGRYILFLNPDTLVGEDSFVKTIAFLSAKPEAGALGIRMVDGNGRFLKESKRSFPSPATSLYKLAGLARLFPRSKIFARYHLGHLDNHSHHDVDVLAGAYMLIKKEVLEKTGGFDEAFFMYGEDIDLSYRIQEAGYRNYYFAESSIIHFKGESTRKGNINYVRLFYKAMSIFVHKHYGGSKAGIFNMLIQAGILARGVLSAVAGFIRRIGLPLMDAGLILLSFWIMKGVWNSYVKTDTQYENRLLWIAFPLFTITYMLTAYYAGLYDRWYRRAQLLRTTVIATILLLAGYSLLPEQYRFSRAIILLGAVLAFILMALLRRILINFNVIIALRQKEKHAQTVVAATSEEYEEVARLLEKAGHRETLLGRLRVNGDDGTAVGAWNALEELQQQVPFEEVVYCAGKLSYREIIDYISVQKAGKTFKIHAAGSGSIVGSDFSHTAGESLSGQEVFSLADPYQQRLKRLVDMTVAIGGLLFFPLSLFFIKKPIIFFGNCFAVIAGKKTWIGYAASATGLPPLRKSVLACNGLPAAQPRELPLQSLQMMDYWYARDYEPSSDLRIIIRQYRRLGGA